MNTGMEADPFEPRSDALPSGTGVLFVTSELRPLVSAGGLGEAAAGLVAALRAAGVDVTVVLPDYSRTPLADETTVSLDVPPWASPASVRVGVHPDAGRIALVDVPGIERPDPYVDENGDGWTDNVDRFLAFSAATAALAAEVDASIVHLNDWHTATVPAFLPRPIPTMLTIHNLGHQGYAEDGWIDRLLHHRDAYAWGNGMSALAGAIRCADVVSTVSPNYAAEILTPAHGMGLQDRLRERGDGIVGIRNGIDVRAWDPEIDTHTAHFTAQDLDGKAQARAALLQRPGWSDTGDPIMVLVTRLVEQKGVDLVFEAARFLDGMRARMMVLGSGDRRLADWARWLEGRDPDRFWFFDGYDVPLSHELFAGGDVLLMPSRFEPCGLAQMQAMAYGTIPVVTAVGGLVDTVLDADAAPDGNGFVATVNDESGIVDAIHRSLRAVRHAGRKRAIQRRGMTVDWSWTVPAQEYIAVYRRLIDAER